MNQNDLVNGEKGWSRMRIGLLIACSFIFEVAFFTIAGALTVAPYAANSITANVNTSRTDVGRTGNLLTNVNLRSCSDKKCDSLGEHFKNAHFRVVETTNKDGVTWYKVKITRYGCHALNPNWCGKKLPREKRLTEVNRNFELPGDENASDSGWVNSYNRDLGVYTVKLD